MRTLIMIVSCIILFTSCGSDSMSESDTKAYTEQKNNLAGEEKRKPLAFLRVSASDKKNFFGSTVIRGSVSNSATVCSYKDVRLRLLSFDKDGNRLEEHEDVIRNVLAPNTITDFRLRYHLPKSADSISVSVMSAVAAE